MPRIGGADLARAFLAIESQCVHPDVFAPEDLFEFRLQISGLRFQIVSQVKFAKSSRHSSRGTFSSVGITLDFAQGNRGLGQGAISVKD